MIIRLKTKSFLVADYMPRVYVFCFLFNLGTITSAKEPVVKLLPIKDYSFCTSAQEEHRVGLVGEAWALEFGFNNKEVTSKSGQLSTTYLKFYQGLTISRFIGRSAGRRRPPLPENSKYTSKDLEKVTILFNRMESLLVFDIKKFKYLNQTYFVVNNLPLDCMHPLP